MPPEYILDHWTEEEFELMFVKRAERLEHLAAMQEPAEKEPKRVSEQQLFALAGITPRVVREGQVQ